MKADTTITRDRLVITRWSTVSPFGIGKETFADGVIAGIDSAVEIDPQQWQVPDSHACLVPDFNVRELLGKKGTRSMNRVTALAVATVGQLLDDTGCERDALTALVLGTTTGSTQSMMDFTRSSLTAAQPFFVDPAQMPSTVMNCAAGQCAIWYQLKGPNTTIANGHTAGLVGLSYAHRLLNSGRAKRVLVGAAEEYSNARSWLGFHAGGGVDGATLGEGCAMLLVEPAATAGAYGAPLAEVMGVSSAVYLDGDPEPTLTVMIRNLLAQAGASADDVWVVSASGVPGQLGSSERSALRAVFAEEVLVRVSVAELLGDTASASGTFQIAAVLALAERDSAAAGRLALISSVDQSGSVSCALLRLTGAVS